MDKEEEAKAFRRRNCSLTALRIKVNDNNQADTQEATEEKKEEVEITPEDKIKELEDKLARTFAEMENQRRRFEKEKEDAFEYGGTSFAREALNLIDNLERSKQVLENDEKLKNTEALNKTLEHFRYY
jgi:molecular chaperone GrpE